MEPRDQSTFEVLAIQLLNALGNANPSPLQFELMISLISKTQVSCSISLANQLSQREKICLLLAAKGNTAGEIAKLLNLQESTIKTYYKFIREKLGCRTIAQAVFEGVRLGFLGQHEK